MQWYHTKNNAIRQIPDVGYVIEDVSFDGSQLRITLSDDWYDDKSEQTVRDNVDMGYAVADFRTAIDKYPYPLNLSLTYKGMSVVIKPVYINANGDGRRGGKGIRREERFLRDYAEVLRK